LAGNDPFVSTREALRRAGVAFSRARSAERAVAVREALRGAACSWARSAERAVAVREALRGAACSWARSAERAVAVREALRGGPAELILATQPGLHPCSASRAFPCGERQYIGGDHEQARRLQTETRYVNCFSKRTREVLGEVPIDVLAVPYGRAGSGSFVFGKCVLASCYGV
jgi:hypothetical protein